MDPATATAAVVVLRFAVGFALVLSSSSKPDHMSSLKWSGDEPGVAKIAAASRKLVDEHSLFLQEFDGDIKQNDKNIEELHGVIAQKDKKIEELQGRKGTRRVKSLRKPSR